MAFFSKFSRTLSSQGKEAQAHLKPESPETNESDEDSPSGGRDIALGSIKLGDAALECNFLQSISRWGELGLQPAGLLHFSLTAEQKTGIQLEWAEFSIIFREYTDGSPSPEVLSHYLKPVTFSGKEIEREIEQHGELAPELEVGAGPARFKAKVGSKGNKRGFHEKFYWTVTGKSNAATENDARVTRAIWLWQANGKAVQASPMTLRGGLVVASVIEGDFQIELQLRGKLKHWHQRVWNNKWFGKDDMPPMVREVHSSRTEHDLKKRVLNLENYLEKLNIPQQRKE